jgi:hypothetical protein
LRPKFQTSKMKCLRYFTKYYTFFLGLKFRTHFEEPFLGKHDCILLLITLSNVGIYYWKSQID